MCVSVCLSVCLSVYVSGSDCEQNSSQTDALISTQGSSQCGKQPFSENRVQIGSSVWLEFCSQAEPDRQADKKTDTHTHTDTQTNYSENITPPLFHGGVIILFYRSFVTNMMFYSSSHFQYCRSGYFWCAN